MRTRGTGQFFQRERAVAAVGLALVIGLGGQRTDGAATGAPAGEVAFFDTRRLLEVRIEMAPRDWESLRQEHHDLLAALGPRRLEQREPKPYQTYRADATLDGRAIKSVGIRKRGFFGSASFRRPSLGIKCNEYDKEKSVGGRTRVSLNNNLQDPSQLRQVLAYRLFAQAGVPAPRCSLARVTVNGNDLGIYSHVEAVKKPFLKRHFGSAAGNLYEGQLSDFRPDWVKTFEKKNNDESDRRDLEAVVLALQSDDAHLLERLEPLLDLDAYLTYWAVETLLGLWDSYSNNGNNFFVYRHPASGKFRFIPWGADAGFGDTDPFTPFQTPESVMARSLLPYRLYRLPATRERYRQRLRQVLDTVWHETELLAEVDRLQQMIRNQVHVSPAHFRAGITQLRRFIRTRRAVLMAELDGAPPEWDFPLKTGPCLEKAGTITADFSTTWQSSLPLNPMTNGTLTLNLELDGDPMRFAATSANALPARDPRNDGCPTVSLVGMRRGNLNLQVLALVIQPEYYRAGAPIPVDGFTAAGVFLGRALLGGQFRITGIPLGTLQLREAGRNPGDPVSGQVKADLYRMPR